MYLQNLLKKYPWTFCPQTLTFITCLSKCRIGDVFKHFFLLFLYLFRMNEQGGGQMTCYWYVLISLKFLSIVCFWEEIIYCTVPTLRYIFNTKLRWDWTLNSVNFVSNHLWNIYWQIGQNDMKLSCGIHDSTHNLWSIHIILWNFMA